jgi:hypothetical protein
MFRESPPFYSPGNWILMTTETVLEMLIQSPFNHPKLLVPLETFIGFSGPALKALHYTKN